MRDNVDNTTSYASFWLPDSFKEKNISSFGKTVFQNIIKDTVEHNRDRIIEQINQFDDIARQEAASMEQQGVDINSVIENLLDRELDNIHMGQTISFIKEFEQGNELFNSS